MAQTVNEWVEGYRLAWENRDAEAVAGLFTPGRPIGRTFSRLLTKAAKGSMRIGVP
jgi:hypothetical protein